MSNLRWRCRTCGLELRFWAAAERHVDEVHRAGRVELLIAEAPDA